MAEQRIPHGPGNLSPESESKWFLAAGTIVANTFITHGGTTGYSAIECTAILCPIGIAKTAASSGDWFEATVDGYHSTITNNGTDVVAGDLLYASTNGYALPLAASVATTGGEPGAIALQADTSTTCTGVMVVKR
jgi:hypothetical protein